MTTPQIPKRGRPPLDPITKSIRVCVRLPESELKITKAVARRDRESIQDVIRRGLRRELSKDG